MSPNSLVGARYAGANKQTHCAVCKGMKNTFPTNLPFCFAAVCCDAFHSSCPAFSFGAVAATVRLQTFHTDFCLQLDELFHY